MAPPRSGKGKKKDEKPPPPTGPGSKIKALPEPLKKQFIKRIGDTQKVHLAFGTANFKSLPVEIYNNEELSALTVKSILLLLGVLILLDEIYMHLEFSLQ